MQRYGEAYAKYKAKVLSENPDLSDSRNLVHCTKVDDDPGYKNDSDDDGFYYGADEDTEQFKEQYREEESSDEDNNVDWTGFIWFASHVDEFINATRVNVDVTSVIWH